MSGIKRTHTYSYDSRERSRSFDRSSRKKTQSRDHSRDHSRDRSRDPSKENIRHAFKAEDVATSKFLHQTKGGPPQGTPPMSLGEHSDDSAQSDDIVIQLESEESHKTLGDYVKSIIYGGLDGTITTFAVVAGVQGADLPAEAILVLGIANLVADALSMGVGDYLSERAELDYNASECRREKWEFENFREGEIQEMIEIYEEKGVKRSDAEIILRRMAQYPDFFVEHMMVQELEMTAPDGTETPAKGGLVTFTSFICFGVVPLLSYVVFEAVEFRDFNPKFLISIILTLLTLFSLGAVKAKLTETNFLKSGLFVMFNGAAAAAASYGIGVGLSQLTAHG